MLRICALALAAVLLATAPATAHKGNPNFLTRVDRITPADDGITVEVINRDDQLELHNTSGETIIIEGYEGEPYARLAADGTVSVNENSEAFYINDDRFGDVAVPDGVDGSGPPKWKDVGQAGRFAWHDHRMHYMARNRPPQVSDPDKRQVVLDWDVPITVDGETGQIAGTLFWTPDPDAPVGFIVGGSEVVLIGSAVVLVLARRRGREDASEVW